MVERNLIVGLDGVTFDWLDRLISEGRCPTFARLLREGVRADMRSTFPPITAVAWTSLATGKNPGKHGIFEFFLSPKGDRRPMAANASLRDAEAVWDIANRSGLRSIITNFPCTYPPANLNGAMISDFMTPRGRRDFTSPRELLEEIESTHGPYRLYLTQTYAPGNADRVIGELMDELRYKCAVNRYLMSRSEWDLFITHIWGTDRIQHELWHMIDEDHPRHNPAEAQSFLPSYYTYWDEVDRQLSILLKEAGETASVWVVSDHGFGPVHKYCSFNLWLLEQGFLTLNGGGLTRLKRTLFDLGVTPEFAYRLSRHWVFKALRPSRGMTTDPASAGLLSRLFLSFHDVDWSKTQAYSKGNYGQIFINVQGREPQGIVGPGEEVDRVRDRIVARLRQLQDPETRRPLIGPIWAKNQLYSGAHIDDAPDICFLPHDMRFLALGNTDFNSNRFITGAFGNSGGHRMNGILIAHGSQIRHGLKLDPVSIYDVMPTILYQMGLKIPDDLDGRVVTEMFDPSVVSAHPPCFYTSKGVQGPRSTVEFSPEEDAEIDARLRSLGYLG